MKKLFLLLTIGFLLIIVNKFFNLHSFDKLHNQNKDLILTALPSNKNTYYTDFHSDLVRFNQMFRQTLDGSDNLKILTKKNLTQETLNFIYDDIWVRDVAPVVTTRLVKFNYQPEYLDNKLSFQLDKKFRLWLDSNQFNYQASPLILDGGNCVWDKKETVIITDRVLTDNKHWTKKEIITQLQKDLQVKNIIIIPTEPGDVLSHADGMVKFINDNTLFISDFLGDSTFKKKVEDIIRQTLPTISIVEMASSYVEEGQYDENIASAKGLYINMLETNHAIYLPQFGLPADGEQIKFVSRYTDKTVIPIPINDISTMGGAINCLTWYCPKELLPTNFLTNYS